MLLGEARIMQMKPAKGTNCFLTNHLKSVFIAAPPQFINSENEIRNWGMTDETQNVFNLEDA